MASFTPHGQSTPFLCIDQCLDPPIVRIAWIQALRVGNVKWPVYRPLGLCGVLLLAGKPASSGERVNLLSMSRGWSESNAFDISVDKTATHWCPFHQGDKGCLATMSFAVSGNAI